MFAIPGIWSTLFYHTEIGIEVKKRALLRCDYFSFQFQSRIYFCFYLAFMAHKSILSGLFRQSVAFVWNSKDLERSYHTETGIEAKKQSILRCEYFSLHFQSRLRKFAYSVVVLFGFNFKVESELSLSWFYF